MDLGPGLAAVVAPALGPGPDPGRSSDVDDPALEDVMKKEEEALRSKMWPALEPFLQPEKRFTIESAPNLAPDVTAPAVCPVRTATSPHAIDVAATAGVEVWMMTRKPPELTLIVE
jgi:hypothetical protein